VTRDEFLAALEPGTRVRLHDHFVGVLLTYRVIWRRRSMVCLKLDHQRHITTRILVVPDRRYVLQEPATIHFLDRHDTPTITLTIAT